MTNKVTHYDLPVPTKEKVVRGLFWVAAATAAIAGINFIGPHALTAANTVFDIANVLVRFGVLVGCAFVGFIAAMTFWPVVKNGIAVAGYQAMNFMRVNYPLEQMGIWEDFLKKKLEETLAGERVIKGIEKENQDAVEAAKKRLDEIANALKDTHVNLTQDERNELETEAAGLVSEKQVYEAMVARLSEPLSTVRLFAEFQQRGIRNYEVLMRTSLAKHTANASLSRVNGVLKSIFGHNPEKENAIAAREAIVRQLGNTLGELEGMQIQMHSLITASQANDKVALANARRYLTDKMNSIEAPTRVVSPNEPTRRLLDH